jgi:chromosome segregation ATPase
LTSTAAFIEVAAPWRGIQPLSLSGRVPILADQAQSLNNEPPSLNDEAPRLNDEPPSLNDEAQSLNDEPQSLNDEPLSLNDEPQSLNDEPQSLNDEAQSLNDEPQSLNDKLSSLKVLEDFAKRLPFTAENYIRGSKILTILSSKVERMAKSTSTFTSPAPSAWQCIHNACTTCSSSL